MKKVIVLSIMLITFFACRTNGDHQKETDGGELNSASAAKVNKDALQADIESLKKFFATQTGKALDKKKGAEMVEKCQQYAEAFPEDAATPGYLFIGGEVARSIRRFEDAIQMFTKVESEYPNHERAATALFLKAFTYEDDLKNKDLAKKYYHSFLEKYPQDPLVEQVKQLLSVIDKSPEELIQEFEKQRKQ